MILRTTGGISGILVCWDPAVWIGDTLILSVRADDQKRQKQASRPCRESGLRWGSTSARVFPNSVRVPPVHGAAAHVPRDADGTVESRTMRAATGMKRDERRIRTGMTGEPTR